MVGIIGIILLDVLVFFHQSNLTIGSKNYLWKLQISFFVKHAVKSSRNFPQCAKGGNAFHFVCSSGGKKSKASKKFYQASLGFRSFIFYSEKTVTYRWQNLRIYFQFCSIFPKINGISASQLFCLIYDTHINIWIIVLKIGLY